MKSDEVNHEVSGSPFDATFGAPTLDDQIEFINTERGNLHLWLDLASMPGDEAPIPSEVTRARRDLAMYTAIQDNLTRVRALQLDNDGFDFAPVHFELTWSWIWRRAAVAAVIILILIWLV